jgi:hypothetical protein
MASRRCESVFELASDSWCVNCWSREGAEVASDCWLRTIDFALKLVSVKLAAFAFVFPTLSLVFWKSCFFSLFFLALDPILAALSSTVKQIHATKVKTPTEKIPPAENFGFVFCGVVLSYQSYQSHQLHSLLQLLYMDT